MANPLPVVGKNAFIHLEYQDSLTASQLETAHLTTAVLGSLSLVVVTFCIGLVLVLKQYRKSHYHIILALLCGFWPDVLIQAISRLSWQYNVAWCQISAFILQLASQAEVLWAVAIAINLYRMCVKHVRTTQKELKYYHWFIWTLGTFTSFLPMTTDSYGPATQWCWIDNSPMGVFWRFCTFYVPLLFYFFIIIVVYFLIGRRLYSDRTAPVVSQKANSSAKSPHQAVFRLLLFPLVFLIGWIPPVINRFSQLTHGGKVNYELTMSHIIFRGIIPILSCIVYLYPLARQLYRRWLAKRQVVEVIGGSTGDSRVWISTESNNLAP